MVIVLSDLDCTAKPEAVTVAKVAAPKTEAAAAAPAAAKAETPLRCPFESSPRVQMYRALGYCFSVLRSPIRLTFWTPPLIAKIDDRNPQRRAGRWAELRRVSRAGASKGVRGETIDKIPKQ